VKGLQEGDVVLPTVPLLGTYRQAAVVKAKQIVRVGALGSGSAGAHVDAGQSAVATWPDSSVYTHVCCCPGGATDVDDLPLPLEYLAVYRELALAYKLLEGDGGLKVRSVLGVP
jgi:hypothetical protein